jgi:2-amino-4-hydroxy-6-hydroxymethyldihydropteridine diphosphokinase
LPGLENWRRVGLGFGANLGDSAANLRRAVDCLRAAGLEFDAFSSLYRTKPWGVVDQPDFVNACALARATHAPLELLDLVQTTEKAMGRRPGLRWGPRPIDIDILFYEDLVLRDERLILPHEGLLERAFVLLPLAEIAPDMVISGSRLGAAAERIDAAGVARIGPF